MKLKLWEPEFCLAQRIKYFLIFCLSQYHTVYGNWRIQSRPAAWGSQGHQVPRPHLPQDQRRCGIGQAGCLGPPAPWNSSYADSPPTLHCPLWCSQPSWPGSWYKSAVGSSPTNWRWLSHSEQWPSGTALYKNTVIYTRCIKTYKHLFSISLAAPPDTLLLAADGVFKALR